MSRKAIILLFNFLKRIYIYRSIIITMAIREIQSRYVGTLAGFVWFVIDPLIIGVGI
jgi:ABC-type polysaccharide/polyol phosphate export permease